MAHCVAGEVEVDLDEIWLYVAKESGGMDVATRLVDSITDRFSFLDGFPYAGRARDRDFGGGSRSFAAGELLDRLLRRRGRRSHSSRSSWKTKLEDLFEK
jgi:plasmid stabilization system protein ParE